MIYRCIRNLPIPKIDEEGRVYIDITDDENTPLMRLEAVNEDRSNTGSNA